MHAPMNLKPFAKLKVALVSDELTRCCLSHECRIWNVTPMNYRLVFRYWKPDILFVESAWKGVGNSWKFKIAAYPDHPQRSNVRLAEMVAIAKEMGIPCLFWNKEDGVHFERFIASASLFDAILTVDENCVPRYRSRLGSTVPVGVLPFAVQPAIHYPDEGHERGEKKYPKGNFVGSYSKHIHPRRREWQEMLMHGASDVGLDMYDRNSGRWSPIYRYPNLPGIKVKSAVAHPKTRELYSRYCFSLNVNTVEDSATMFSRRLVEIMASGGLAVTTPAKSVEHFFEGLCHVVESQEQARELFTRLKHGYLRADRDMISEATEKVHREFTWTRRLEQICDVADGCRR
jgi:hypothetical protein